MKFPLLTTAATTAALIHAVGVNGQIPVSTNSSNSHGIEYPVSRYRQYAFLSEEMKALVDDLGYTENTWNHPGSDTIELIGYDGLPPNAQDVVGQLNITKGQWDCYINHYRFLEWKQLTFIVSTDSFFDNTDRKSNVLNVQQYYSMLGWNEDLWMMSKVDDNQIPESELHFWDELSPDQQLGAMELCYFEHTWNDETLQDWTTRPPTVPPTAAPTTTSKPEDEKDENSTAPKPEDEKDETSTPEPEDEKDESSGTTTSGASENGNVFDDGSDEGADGENSNIFDDGSDGGSQGAEGENDGEDSSSVRMGYSLVSLVGALVAMAITTASML